ncbi:MAG: DUF4157 domain-containing protein [Chloroflexi bacterium]|nr:DUF4157 domain-containing protein [Chloroflexota bacterium]
MDEPCKRSVRKMYAWEEVEYGLIFGDSLDYGRVRIHECNPWPDRIDRLGRKLKGLPAAEEGEHNAVTLGNHLFFPVEMPQEKLPAANRQAYKHRWMAHELTHAWQFQSSGWSYLVKALAAQFRDKEKAYDFEGEDGLLKSRSNLKLFKDFNPEQQGNIVETYYDRLAKGIDVRAWEPYIEDIKREG